MGIDSKTVLQEVVTKYLDAEEPDRKEEFSIVFDDVYEVVNSRFQKETAAASEDGRNGIPFDTGMVVGTVISTTCWIGMTLLRAVIKYSAKQGVAATLDHVERELVAKGAAPTMVHKLRVIVQGVVENC